MSEWQPIETAPRDGTEILICDVHQKVFIGYWQTRKSKKARTGWKELGCGFFFEDDPDFAAKYWMPKPNPPETTPEAFPAPPNPLILAVGRAIWGLRKERLASTRGSAGGDHGLVTVDFDEARAAVAAMRDFLSAAVK